VPLPARGSAPPAAFSFWPPPAPGVTEPFSDVTVSASVAGTIEKLRVKEGDFVQAGQPILEQKKRLEELEVSRRKLLMDSKAELDAAIARVETLKVDLASTRALFESTKSVSKDDLAKKELEFNTAVAEVDRLKTAEAREVIELDLAQEQLDERTIRSPLAGIVVELYRDPGEDCKAQEPVARIVDVRQFYFVANIEARQGFHLKVGQTVRVDVKAGKQVISVQGSIQFVSPVVDAASGLLKVKVLCPNADGRIKPGADGNMHFPEE
jgi:membrane fusion protein, multidrug efflux system